MKVAPLARQYVAKSFFLITALIINAKRCSIFLQSFADIHQKKAPH